MANHGSAWQICHVTQGTAMYAWETEAGAEIFPDAAILVTGVEDPDTRAHGANEGLHLAEFERVCLAEALLLQKLAALAEGSRGWIR